VNTVVHNMKTFRSECPSVHRSVCLSVCQSRVSQIKCYQTASNVPVSYAHNWLSLQ